MSVEKRSCIVQVRLKPSTYKKVKEIAKREKTTASEVIRAALREGLKIIEENNGVFD
jgi:metal-responsive CopG/Arc/MetJ family transcriptional regulator